MIARKAIFLLVVGALLGFVQVRVSSDGDPGWNAIRSLWRIDRTNSGDAGPSIEAASRIAKGQPTYTEFSGQGFLYPPLVAVPYRPLVGLSQTATSSWLFFANRFLLAAIFVLLFLFARPAGTGAAESIRLAGALVICLLFWHPLLRALELNQAMVLITALIGASLLAIRRGKDVVAGIAYAMAIAIHPLLALAVPLLYWHARRVLVSATLAGFALALISVAYAGWAAHVDYLTRVLPSLSTGYAFYSNQSWSGLVGRLLHPEAALSFEMMSYEPLVRVASWALGGLTYLYIALQIRGLPRDAGLRVDVFGLAWLAVTLAVPISLNHHYAPAIFCLVMLYQRFMAFTPARQEASTAVTRVLMLSAVLMAAYVEVRGFANPAALIAASYVFIGAGLLGMAWPIVLAGEKSMQAFSRWVRRLGRWLLPLPRAVEVRLEAAVLAACVLFSLYLIAHLLLFQYGRDQGIYAVVARTMIEGGAPYRDAWDFKPPGIFFIFALARMLFGSGMHGIRILEALGLLSLFPAFILISRRCVDSWRPALPAVALAVMAYVQLEFWNTAQPESFAAFFLVWAIVLCCSDLAILPRKAWPRQELLWVAIGCLLGVASVLKPQLGGGVVLLPFLLGYLRAKGSGRAYAHLRASLGPFLFLALGAALPIVLVTVYFASQGALGWMVETLFGFVPHYSKLGHQDRGSVSLIVQGLSEALFRFSRHDALGILLVLGLPVLALRERWALLLILAVLFFPVLGVGLQAKFFPYHYGTIVPLLALPAAWGFWKLWVRLRSYIVPILVFAGLMLLLKDERILPPYKASLWDRNWVRLMVVFGAEDQRDELLDLLHRGADVNAGDNRRAARCIAQNTSPEETLFIWGFEPVIYDLAQRPIVTRYIYNVAQRVPWAFQHRQLLMDDLTRHPPSVVVLETHDVFRHVTGDDLDSVQALLHFPELDSFLRTHYVPGPRFGKLALLLRRR